MSISLEGWARDLVRCPAGKHTLVDATNAAGEPVLRCTEDCPGPGERREYPIREGLPILLIDDAQIVPA